MKIKLMLFFLSFSFFGCGSSSISCGASADPTSGQNPLVVQFTEKASGELVYHWDFGDGTDSSQDDPSHQYTLSNPNNQETFFAFLAVTNLGSTAVCNPIAITVFPAS